VAEILTERRDHRGMATIMARKGIDAARIGTALAIEAPTSPACRRNAEGLILLGTGPGNWLASADNADPFWAERLRERLDGLASVSDQSGAYVGYRLSGEGARTVLQRGLSIDLHPDAFGPGAALTSAIAHIGVVLWMVDAASYDLALYRSYADSFHHWLHQMIDTL